MRAILLACVSPSDPPSDPGDHAVPRGPLALHVEGVHPMSRLRAELGEGAVVGERLHPRQTVGADIDVGHAPSGWAVAGVRP
jgi:hypothetical protein